MATKALGKEELTLREKLIESASKGITISYNEVALLGDDRHTSRLSKIFENISMFELSNDRILSVVLLFKRAQMSP